LESNILGDVKTTSQLLCARAI